MKVVIVYNHPYEGSYCNALLQAVLTGLQTARHEADLIHLDRDDFDPVMRAKDLAAFARARQPNGYPPEMLDSQVLQYQQRLEQAEHLVFLFPIWWELMPARTKGFIDKVIFPGIAYDYAEGGQRMVSRLPRLRGLTVITTMNTPSLLYRLVFGNAIKHALLTGTFWKIGVRNRKWISLNRVKFVSAEKREKWLREMEKRFAAL